MAEIDLHQYAPDIWNIVQDGITRKIIDLGEFTSFLELNDTPDSFSGEAAKLVAVNAGETALEFVTVSSIDQRVKVTAADTTNDFLQPKLVAGTGITISLTSPGGNEKLTIATTITQYTDELAQDAIGAMIDGSLAYVDATPLLQRAALSGAITASAGSNTTALGSFTKSQLDTAVSDGNILYVGDITQYTDELAQDAVGGILLDGATIDFTYNDGANTITAEVIQSALTISNMGGTLATGHGGTGLTGFTQGDIPYASSSSVISLLAKNTTATRYLSNGGTNNNPAWAQVDLTTGVTGTLPIGNGGTGQTTANAALNALLPSQSTHNGEFLKSDGTNTSWAAPGGSGTVNSGAAGALAYYPTATTLVDDMSFGTANQVLGMNSGATGYEHKTITAGAGLTVTHAANSITISDDLSGWLADSNTWTYSSADSPSFVLTINADLTGVLGLGDRVKLTQTTVKYFIVTKISVSSGTTTLTIYGGTDYTLANAAISSPFFSHQKSPFGFPMNRDKWTVLVRDTTKRTQNTPTASTWYNLGSVSINIPIGVWRVEYFVLMDHIKSSANETSMSATLSDANNTQGDQDMTSKFYGFFNGASSSSNEGMGHGTAGKIFTLTTKATWYMNAMTTLASSASISFDNDTYPCNIRAICDYL